MLLDGGELFRFRVGEACSGGGESKNDRSTQLDCFADSATKPERVPQRGWQVGVRFSSGERSDCSDESFPDAINEQGKFESPQAKARVLDVYFEAEAELKRRQASSD